MGDWWEDDDDFYIETDEPGRPGEGQGLPEVMDRLQRAIERCSELAGTQTIIYWGHNYTTGWR